MSAPNQPTPKTTPANDQETFRKKFDSFLVTLSLNPEVRTAFGVEADKKFNKTAFKTGLGIKDNNFSGWLTGNNKSIEEKHQWCKWFQAFLSGDEDNNWTLLRKKTELHKDQVQKVHRAVTLFLNSEQGTKNEMLWLVESYMQRLTTSANEEVKTDNPAKSLVDETARSSLIHYPIVRIERDNIRNSSTTFASLYLDTAQGRNGVKKISTVRLYLLI